jgi:hypothetical protein
VYPQPKEGNTTKQKKNNSYNKMKARTHSNKSFYFPTIKISADDVEKISKKKKIKCVQPAQHKKFVGTGMIERKCYFVGNDFHIFFWYFFLLSFWENWFCYYRLTVL